MSTITLEPSPEVLPSVAATAPSRVRHTTLDVCRLLAAYAIVWLHTPRPDIYAASALLGRFAVPFFTAAATLFAWQSGVRPGRPMAEYARSRVMRIYVPFLAWCGIYLAFKGAKALVLPGEPNDFPGIELLWLGSFYHLWFMPFVFLLTLAVFGLARLTVLSDARARNRLGEIAVFLLAALAGWHLALLPADSPTGTVGFGQLALDALPSACWGLALAIPLAHGRLTWLRHRWVSLACLAVSLGLTLWLCTLGRNRPIENLSGLALLVFALGDWSGWALERIARLGPLAYGIYLSHLLFIKTLEAIGPKLGFPLSLATSLAIFALAAAGSTLLAWLLTRSRWTRWLTAG